MRKNTVICLMFILSVLFGLCGCGQKDPINTVEDTSSSTSEDKTSSKTSSNGETDTSSTEDNTSSTINEKEISESITTASSTKPPKQETKPPTDTPTSKPETTPPSSSERTKPSVDVPDMTSEKALAEIANMVVEKISKYRIQEGIPACTNSIYPNMIRYAKYRSSQLPTNFSHDMQAIKEAKNAVKYGVPTEDSRYDPATDEIIYTGEIVYMASISEAIGRISTPAINTWTKEQLANKIATGFYESKDHWQGLSDTTTTKHMAAGITYKNGKYWTCIVYGDDITASYG